MKKYDLATMKAARVTLRNAAERKGSWWKLFARYAEIAKRKIWWIEMGLLACLILSIGGCGTFDGLSKLADGVRQDVHHITQPVDKEK